MRLMGVIEESASEINIHSHHVRSGNDVISYLKAKETELEHSNIRVILDIDAKCTNAVLSEMVSLLPCLQLHKAGVVAFRLFSSLYECSLLINLEFQNQTISEKPNMCGGKTFKG